MTWARRVDANHANICAAIRERSWSVLDLSRVGGGAPDILIGAAFYTIPAEIKTETGKLNELQQVFHKKWMGSPILILRDPLQAVMAIREEMRRQWRKTG